MKRARTHGRRLLGSLVPILLLLSGCGTHRSVEPALSRPATFAAAAFSYAACMRQHGLASFPDPQIGDHNGERVTFLAPPAQILASPGYPDANKACSRILPPPVTQNNAQEEQGRRLRLLAFARCMRADGISEFPDPTSNGQLTIETVQSSGVDPRAPTVRAAATSCLPTAGGAITARDIERAVTGQ